jgi:hypothetical protein
MPTSVSAVLVLIAFIMPGFIAGRVLSSAHSNSEASDGRLVLGAITWSCINYAVLSGLLVWAWSQKWYEHPLNLALLAFCTLFLSPVLIALATVKVIDTAWGRRVRVAFGMAHPVSKAWDAFFRRGIPCWILATLKGGRVIAGLYGGNSFASSFPAPEDLYLEKICRLSAEGEIEGLADFSRGGIIRMENVESLELFDILNAQGQEVAHGK